jgi:hypothetical protein
MFYGFGRDYMAADFALIFRMRGVMEDYMGKTGQ